MTTDEAIRKAAVSYLPSTYKRLLIKLEEDPLDSVGISEFLGMTPNA